MQTAWIWMRLHANSLDLDETPSNSASRPGPSYLTRRNQFSPISSNIKVLWNLKQTRNLADQNSFGRLWV